jgi:hypothetical protein
MIRSKIARAGSYHFPYFQLDLDTREYYIGKVNRKKRKEITQEKRKKVRPVSSVVFNKNHAILVTGK